jgi:exopolysaccharide biosynthesis polyprenyl glycosylphosphotransferase
MFAPQRPYDPAADLLLRERAAPAAVAESDEWPERRGSVLVNQDWGVALVLGALDVVSWILIYGVTCFLRRDIFFIGPFEFVLVDVVQLFVIIQALYIIGGYDRKTEMRGLAYMTEHLLAVLGAGLLSSLLIYSVATYDQGMKPSRGAVLVSFVAFLPWSLIYRRVVQRYLVETTASRAFLVIGSGEMAARFYEAYRQSPNRQQLHFVDSANERAGERIAGPTSPLILGDCAGKLTNLHHRYSGIILAEDLRNLSTDLIERLVRTQFQRARVYTLESFYELHWRHVPVQSIDPVWPLQMGFQLARNSPYHYLKRLFDVALSSALFCLSAPFLVVIALLIWVSDGSPVIFRQERIGREGQGFTIFKFRTMNVRKTEDQGDIYTRKDDARITRLGRWLRKLRLDEVPQLWNVLRGDMSLIGPRAEWSKCAERYEKNIPFYHFRHLVKPGITGWAQVNYPYGESDEDAIEKLKYDLYYIRHYSLKLDAMIVLKTVHTMLFGKGR